MQIGNKAMLAVELMAWLRSCNRLRPGKTVWLANRIQHSVSYTECLLAKLRETGLVCAKKGAGGGYYLAKPPETISIADILAAFDAPQVDVAARQPGTAWADEDLTAAVAVDALCLSVRDTALRFLEAVSLARVDEVDWHDDHPPETRRAEKRSEAGLR
jgi:Rrf2 family protein